MQDVEVNFQGSGGRLGWASKNNTPRKLVKKSVLHNDCKSTVCVPESDQHNLGVRGKTRESTMEGSSGSTRRNSLFSLSRMKKQPGQTSSSETKSPRKLSKALQHATSKGEVLDKDTGERKDLTDMLHAFSYTDVTDHDEEPAKLTLVDYDPYRPDGAELLLRMPIDIWTLINEYLSALDIAYLASTCKSTHYLLIRRLRKVFNDPANRHDLQMFLLSMDQKLPNHLFCFPCTKWHLRTHPGHETLKPSQVLNPLFTCPNTTNNSNPPPRLRITEGRTLPLTFLQLAIRHWKHGPTYGVPVHTIARRWKDPYSAWTHETKYHIHPATGHILMRVKSQVFVSAGMTPAAKRLLLFSRSDYVPYFSVCAHWRNGVLTSIPKCALDHIPVPRVNALTQLRTQKMAGPVSLCATCRPIRRCPFCATEYLFELKLVEDKSERGGGPERFKQALLVTRWSDLGGAKCPQEREWAAVTATGNGAMDGYDSFREIGRRAVSGVFESAFSDAVPGQRILSMTPEGEGDGKKGDEDGWY
jgi:hypothetical protein